MRKGLEKSRQEDIGALTLTEQIKRLVSVSDDDLRHQLSRIDLDIDDTKFTQSFNAYGLTNAILLLDLEKLISISECLLDFPKQVLDNIRLQGAIVLRAYIALVYMRSEHLERGLDRLEENSPIQPFRDFFRTGSRKRGNDTLSQHIRNSLCHGQFHFSDDTQYITFRDRDWKETIESVHFFNGLCRQVHRFYLRAYEVKHRKTDSIWISSMNL